MSDLSNNGNPIISRLAICYMSCFPIEWHKRISFHWSPKNKETLDDIIFAIIPMSNDVTNVDFVKKCLSKSFTIVSYMENQFKLSLDSQFFLTVVLLSEVKEQLGFYYCFGTQKCNVKHFLKERIYPFYFKQPKHFVCLKRPRLNKKKNKKKYL